MATASDSFEFLERIFNLIKNGNILRQTREDRVVDFLHPHELERVMDFELGGEPCKDLDQLENLCKSVIKYSIKTSNPNFHNQLFGGVDLYGYAGTVLSESLNTNQHTFEVAPVFSIIERNIFEKVKQIVNFKTGEGIFTPGGSASNMYGIALARFKKFPDIKAKGMYGLPVLVGFTSENSHYSIQKAMNWLGLGTDNLIKIKTDELGRMRPDDLENQIIDCKKNGKVPIFVNATVSTTVLGAIDPLNKIAEVCKTYGIWYHVDACYGGTLLLSKKYRQRLQGIERADSFSWNPHKMLGAPLQCSLFVTRHENILYECNSASAKYLFQQDKFYDISYDTGDKSIQCGRKVDGFKLWVMWKARGDAGFEELVDNVMDCVSYFRTEISKRPNFRLVQKEFDTTAISFWYIPNKLLGKEENSEWWEKISLVAPAIKEKLTLSGKLMIGYQPLPTKNYCNFFRMIVTCHPKPNYENMDYSIKQIEHFGNLL